MTAAPPAAGEIARLTVEIDDVTPRVRRCLEVPVDIRLDDLHFVLQIVIGWQNGHPFEFRIGDKVWACPTATPRPIRCRRTARRLPIFWRAASASNTITCSARIGSTAWRCTRA
jgi:hypothetical protein